MKTKTRLAKKQDWDSVMRICKDLHPNWIDANALRNIPIDLKIQKVFVATTEEKTVGFISIYTVEAVGWIGWLGVDPKIRRQGGGKNLIEHIENYLVRLGVKELKVDTITEQNPPDGTYDETIKFYKQMGFEVLKKGELEEFDGFKFRRGVLRKYYE